MTAPTVAFNRNTGPVQRAQGSISGTYTAASDVSSTPNSTIAAGVMTITLGFVPTKFKITNMTDRVTQEWYKGMAAGNFLETAANGTRTLETDGVAANISVAQRTGTGGSSTQAAGTADTTPSGVVTVTFSGGIVTDNDTVVWEAEG